MPHLQSKVADFQGQGNPHILWHPPRARKRVFGAGNSAAASTTSGCGMRARPPTAAAEIRDPLGHVDGGPKALMWRVLREIDAGEGT